MASHERPLIETAECAAIILARLDDALAQLPEQDHSSWTLRHEPLEEPSSSNIGSGSILQPLCTAVQMLLVELLRQAEVHFAAVASHSSGENAAVFTAGHLPTYDALHSTHYSGPTTI